MASRLRAAGLALVSVAAFLLVWALAVRFVRHGGLAPGPAAWMAVKAAVWLGFAWWWARLAEPSSPLRALGVTRGAVAGLGVGLLVGLAILAMDALRARWADGRWPGIPADPLWAGISPAVEEVALRGALLALLQRLVGFWPANLLVALVFVAVHLPGWWISGTLSRRSLPWDVGVLLVLSLALGWLKGRTGSAWAAVLPRWANDLGARL